MRVRSALLDTGKASTLVVPPCPYASVLTEAFLRATSVGSVFTALVVFFLKGNLTEQVAQLPFKVAL
eukprot:scaffold167268_cov19-Tisochrysis_lutea.AAC.2